MHRIALALGLLLAACSSTGQNATQMGRLQNPAIAEASGLARSHAVPGRFWVMNDGGSAPLLYAIGDDGSDQGTVAIDGAANQDWEDLSSFVLGDRPMLLIADVGDNEAKRIFVTLYILEEPSIESGEENRVPIVWQLNVVFPDGPGDVESVTVDAERQVVLILSKRDVPAVLYEVPLLPANGKPVSIVRAIRRGTVASLPQPTKLDRDQAPVHKSWHWQPTAMDISPSGKLCVILTYRSLHLYRRNDGQSWIDALQDAPRIVPLGAIKEAEAAVFTEDGAAVVVTTEKPHAPLLRFELD